MSAIYKTFKLRTRGSFFLSTSLRSNNKQPASKDDRTRGRKDKGEWHFPNARVSTTPPRSYLFFISNSRWKKCKFSPKWEEAILPDSQLGSKVLPKVERSGGGGGRCNWHACNRPEAFHSHSHFLLFVACKRRHKSPPFFWSSWLAGCLAGWQQLATIKLVTSNVQHCNIATACRCIVTIHIFFLHGVARRQGRAGRGKSVQKTTDSKNKKA